VLDWSQTELALRSGLTSGRSTVLRGNQPASKSTRIAALVGEERARLKKAYSVTGLPVRVE